MIHVDGNEKFSIDRDRLARVAEAIGRGDGDLSDCMAPDIKHVCQILARLLILQDLAPGVVDEMFDELVPYAIKEHNRKVVEAEAANRAKVAGIAAEWEAALAAGRSPHKKDYILRMVEVAMKANNWKQSVAIRSIAEQSGRDEDDIRRVVTRAKARKTNR